MMNGEDDIAILRRRVTVLEGSIWASMEAGYVADPVAMLEKVRGQILTLKLALLARNEHKAMPPNPLAPETQYTEDQVRFFVTVFERWLATKEPPTAKVLSMMKTPPPPAAA